MFTETIARDRYTVSSSVVAPRTAVVLMPDLTPNVFVVDDDLARPRATVPCCLVLDVSLPGLNGLELQQQLAERGEMPIVFITGYGDVPMSVRAMKAGAVEFLTKPFKDDVLIDAIRGAIERSRFALRRNEEMRGLRECYASLTPREREVMSLVCAGLLNKQVGGELGISEITVKAHRGQMMRKMRADSLPDLVTMAAKLGLRTAGSA
jgi:FixJ family two-component response regulator